MTFEEPNSDKIRSIVKKNSLNLQTYADFYRHVHQNPELSGTEAETAKLVADHLKRLGLKVHSGIGGHGVVGIFENGYGKTVLMRAELNAQPVLERTELKYVSEKRMVGQDGRDQPVMHARGHDMNMAALLAAVALLVNSITSRKTILRPWSGKLVVVFEPGRANTSGAQAMINDGLYGLIPIPDLILAQQVRQDEAGTVQIRSAGPAHVSVDSVHIRFTFNVDDVPHPIYSAVSFVQGLPDSVKAEAGRDEVTDVACRSFQTGRDIIDNALAIDVLLDVSTACPVIRRRALNAIGLVCRRECRCMRTSDPKISHAVRAPLTSNYGSIGEPVSKVFKQFFGDKSQDMPLNYTGDDLSTFGAEYQVPYACWGFGGVLLDSTKSTPKIGSPSFAPAIYPTLETGADAMALAALTFLTQK